MSGLCCVKQEQIFITKNGGTLQTESGGFVMRYYVTADVHGFYTIMEKALEEAGFFDDEGQHKLIILGDLFDRGNEAIRMMEFVLGLMEEDRVILIRGNHEDLFEEMVTTDDGVPLLHHVRNRTYDTAIQLTEHRHFSANLWPGRFAREARETPFYTRIIPSMLDYYETEHYIFVHGWIPCERSSKGYSYYPGWRDAGTARWKSARWINGIDAAQSSRAEKTVVCGHWHASYGHARYAKKGTEFGADADFSPYFGPGIIAMDACTAYSGKINVIVLED